MIDPRLSDELSRVRRPLQQAWTLPPRCYVDPDFYALEVKRVLRREWLSIGRVDQLCKPGDYLCVDLLDEPLVAARGKDDRIRVMSRVCRHRAMLLATGEGNVGSFQCPYHNWTYGLDGRLIGAPEMDRVEGFARSEVCLPELRVDIWEGWIFVNFDRDASPLGPRLQPLRDAISPYQFKQFRTLEPLVFDSPWNWKVMVDNFMESYHHAAIHPDTLQPLFPARNTYAEDADGGYAILRNPSIVGPLKSELPAVEGLPEDLTSQLLVAAVFPYHLFAATPESLVYYRIEPRGVDRINLSIYPCVLPEAAENSSFDRALTTHREVLRKVHTQDIAACEGIQAGYRSSFATAGRYSHLEKALWQFHRWLLDRLGE